MNGYNYWLRSDLLLFFLVICLFGMPVMYYVLPVNSQTYFFLGVIFTVVLFTIGGMIFLYLFESRELTYIPMELVKESVNELESELYVEEEYTCPICGVLVTSIDFLCPICNRTTEECLICRNVLRDTEMIRRCPFCFSGFHKEHLFEWIRVKHLCPVCKNELRQDETI
ncbi:MAG: hypothetical protein ACFFCQ_01220 [Promethearchaeota archaeon]